MLKIWTLLIILFGSASFAKSTTLRRNIKWGSLTIEIEEKRQNDIFAGGSCLVKVKKGSKLISSYKFERASAAGGGRQICEYIEPNPNEPFWFARFDGDYKLPYLFINKYGKKQVIDLMPNLYKLVI
jgi:hypothetical protein